MADFSVTISNGAPMLAGTPTVGNWGSLTWNAFLWGYTLDLPLDVGKGVASVSTPNSTITGFSVEKGVASSNAPDSAVGFDVSHGITESWSADSTIGIGYFVVLSNEQTLTGDMEHEYLIDSAGYYHVFHSGTTDGESRDFTSWSTAGATTASWVASSTTATVWS